MTIKAGKLLGFVSLTLATAVCAQETPPLFDPNGLSLIIGGNGSVATKGSTAAVFGSNASLVQTGTLGLPFQLGIRQTIERQRLEGEDTLNIFTTKLFYDAILLKLTKRVDFAAGFNAGILYGNTPLRWRAGPEVGIRWWIRPNAALVGRVDYAFDLKEGPLNVINYFIGFQVKLEKKTSK